MIIMKEFCKIRALARDGVNKSEIARRLHIDRKTVAKYLRENNPPSYAKRQSPTRKDPLLPFEKIIAYWHSSVSDLTGRDIYEKLVLEGYKGSERSVYRRLKHLRASEDKERFFQQSYEAGEQCQFDFKEKVILPFRDGDMAVHLHFGTLPHSGFFFISAWRFKTYEAFAEGAHRFFIQAGGIPRNVRIDNLSPCVAKVLKGDNRIYTSHYNRFMEYYGFETLPCRPGVGSDKGDVEREIRTHTARIVRRCKLEGTAAIPGQVRPGVWDQF
jgi:transposase